MKPGTQVAYIPDHALGDIKHPDVEFGFVTSEKNAVHFCRYWKRNELGILRTTANSESTSTDHLVEKDSVSQGVIQDTVKMYQIQMGEAK